MKLDRHGKGNFRRRRSRPRGRLRTEMSRADLVAIRHGHIVDRALAVARYLNSTRATQAALARSSGLSPGVISRLAGVGAALDRLSPEQIERFRNPVVTWKVVQGISARHRDDQEILAALGAPIITGRSDKRTSRAKRPSRRSAPVLVTMDWVRDPSLTGNSPVAFVRTYRIYLRELHESVGQTLREIIAAGQVKDAGIPMAGQSLRALVAATRRRAVPALSSEATEASQLFASLDAALRPLVGLK